MEQADIIEPLVVHGRTILAPGAPVVWFTFPGKWHDIGRFHTADGKFTGHYANILTPVRFWSELEWDTTDLFLDVWCGADGNVELLDEADFIDAVERGWMTNATADAAQAEAARLLASAQNGTWPPALVHEWTLDRARAAGTRQDDAV
jgi:uncharacterized protein